MRVPDAAILGGRGQGHRLGQARLGPARLAHCMRWIGNAETVLELLTGRALARLVDSADEVHRQQIAVHVIAAFREDGTTRRATGAGLL